VQRKQKQLSILGILIILGASQTGCAVLNGFSASQASTHTVAGNHTITEVTSPPPSVNNRTGSSSQSNQTNSAASTQATATYPSFGLAVTGPEVLALNERLAELGYLPVTVNAATPPTITLSNLSAPPNVTFGWRYGNIPAQVAAQWIPDTYTEMTRAAVIAVEHVNGLAIDGIVGPAVWSAIRAPNARPNPNPYTFVLVTKNPAPEGIRVWQNGKWVYQSVANTGVAAAPSTDGTFAVYERFLSQTMRGTNPNGTKYSDPGVPYVNYYDGSEAIHGFVRASYGYPQSVGCVELPVSHAKVAWSLLHYGTLVTVQGHYVVPGSTTTATSGSTGTGQSGYNHSSGAGTRSGNSTGANSAGKSAGASQKSSGQTGTGSNPKNVGSPKTSTGSTQGSTTNNAASNSTANSAGNVTITTSTASTNTTSTNTASTNTTSNNTTSAANTSNASN
jgi:hypothetical protein